MSVTPEAAERYLMSLELMLPVVMESKSSSPSLEEYKLNDENKWRR
jgi:hypothetical protein